MNLLIELFETETSRTWGKASEWPLLLSCHNRWFCTTLNASNQDGRLAPYPLMKEGNKPKTGPRPNQDWPRSTLPQNLERRGLCQQETKQLTANDSITANGAKTPSLFLYSSLGKENDNRLISTWLSGAKRPGLMGRPWVGFQVCRVGGEINGFKRWRAEARQLSMKISQLSGGNLGAMSEVLPDEATSTPFSSQTSKSFSLRQMHH